nr:translation initiation factor IF-2-like [Procambarus clarkii]
MHARTGTCRPSPEPVRPRANPRGLMPKRDWKEARQPRASSPRSAMPRGQRRPGHGSREGTGKGLQEPGHVASPPGATPGITQEARPGTPVRARREAWPLGQPMVPSRSASGSTCGGGKGSQGREGKPRYSLTPTHKDGADRRGVGPSGRAPEGIGPPTPGHVASPPRAMSCRSQGARQGWRPGLARSRPAGAFPRHTCRPLRTWHTHAGPRRAPAASDSSGSAVWARRALLDPLG